MNYPSKHFVYPGWGGEGYDGENTEEVCGDKQGNAEVAIVGEWNVGGDFARNTFCLVLGNMWNSIK